MSDWHIPLAIPLTFPVLFAAVQIVLDMVLILIVLFLLKRISSFDPRKLEMLIDTLKESRQLCDQLGKTVAENAEIASNIERLVKHHKGQTSTDRGQRQGQEVGTIHEQVLRLWQHGKTIDEISDATGLGRGEVEVITSLAGQQRVKGQPT